MKNFIFLGRCRLFSRKIQHENGYNVEKCISLQGLTNCKNMAYLTKRQRYEIYAKQQNGMNYTQIANAIGVSKSTISRELRRNHDKRNGIYKPDLAQRKHEQRKKTKRRR